MAFRRFEDINKQQWLKEYINKHPRRKNYYDYVKDKKKDKEDYMLLYNNKCIYCGMNFEYVPLSFCEIDHVISQEEDDSQEHSLDNLVCSCRTCNRAKSKSSISILPHPDTKEFSNYFTRNEVYEIISSGVDDDASEKIIKILGFEKRQHKLTYLYDEIIILLDSTQDKSIRSHLLEIKSELDKVRLKEM